MVKLLGGVLELSVLMSWFIVNAVSIRLFMLAIFFILPVVYYWGRKDMSGFFFFFLPW